MNPNKILKRFLVSIALLALVWLLGDYANSEIVMRSVERWEATVDRDDVGVQVGSQGESLRGNDTLFLLVHGYNDTPQTFDLMAPALNARGYSVRSMLLPGFGVPVDQMNDCTYEDWVHAVSELTLAYRQLGDIDSANKYSHIVVVGHSLGGAVAIQAMARSPDLFDAAILLAPAIDVSNKRSPVLPTRFWQKVGQYLLPYSTVYESPFDCNDCRDPEHRNPKYKSPFSTRNIVTQAFRLMDQNRPVAESLNKPLLMVLSRDDQVTDWAAAEAWFERWGTPDKILKFYDTSGHAMTVDHDWQSITNDIVQFTEQYLSQIIDDPADNPKQTAQRN